jgi:protein-tyrosine phosphatase
MLNYLAGRKCWRGALALGAILATAGLAATNGSWAPACDETRNGNYVFEKLGGSTAQPVKISLCADVTCLKHREFAMATQDTYVTHRPSDVARPFFLIERQAEQRIIGARHLALEGAYNFRDLGGIQTRDGKTVRWGQVFRSDALANLTSADYERLNAMGIALVCDLRTREERKSAATEWRDGSPVFILAPVSESDKGYSQNSNVTDALRSGIPLEEGKTLFEKFYVQMVLESAGKFGTVLRALASTDRPSMFHCQGGRDRTGITAAMLLQILGVPEDTILQDYVLSTKYLGERPAQRPAAPLTAAEAHLAEISAEVTRLQPRYIQAVFRAITAKYSSFDKYRRDGLQLSDADVQRLKVRLLE